MFTAMPKFVIRPTAQSVDFNGDASFECQASGFPRPTLFWSVEGNRSIILPGTTSGNFNATSSGEGLSVLTLTQVQRSDNGLVIICSAVNAVGAITARAKLSISSQDDRPPPVSILIIWGIHFSVDILSTWFFRFIILPVVRVRPKYPKLIEYLL